MTTASTALDLSAIAKRYFAAWEAHDIDAIVALHTLDSQFQAHGRGAAVHGSAALRREFAQVFELYPGFGFEERRLLFGIGHWVLDWTLTFQRPGEDRRGVHCLDVVEVASDGLVTRKDTFFDFAELKAAFGGAA
ncbi:nuclear transport factor 2 family protein [Nocardia gipuzkoensis]|uniref:nuclear transport factor 2 family protein n=1 Tax=Nocardia gipuzkoensis TaxID=2749991 RepID=UPI00237D74DD|nr:nuclear transport factor 2 family protein [Nocardia gipuzkoensis]MDE1668988.1 nuclear transport factor 2 family protein [Nocardia gipuzkoensis]